MKCPKCGEDRTDKDASHSDLGQWIHDVLPRTFYWMDVDGLSAKRDTDIIRMIERKRPHQVLKPSQKWILPRLAKGFECMISLGIIASESGIFVAHIESGPDYEVGKPSFDQGGHITQVVPIGGCPADDDLNEELSGTRWKAFLSGEKIKE